VVDFLSLKPRLAYTRQSRTAACPAVATVSLRQLCACTSLLEVAGLYNPNGGALTDERQEERQSHLANKQTSDKATTKCCPPSHDTSPHQEQLNRPPGKIMLNGCTNKEGFCYDDHHLARKVLIFRTLVTRKSETPARSRRRLTCNAVRPD